MSAWQNKLVSIFQKRRLDEELDEEIRAHLEMATEEHVSRGMSLRDARLAARRSFGAIEPMKERHRDVRTFGWLDDLARDLRFGLRSLSRSPGFTVTAMLTLALGIGATTAVFTVVNAVLLRPLPYEDPERLVVVHETTADLPGGYVRPSDFVEYNRHSTVFESLGAHMFPSMRGGDVLGGGDEPLWVPTARVSANLFRLLGVEPILGRSFDSEEDQPGNDVVIMLSHGLWQRHFGANPDVIGQQKVHFRHVRPTTPVADLIGLSRSRLALPPVVDFQMRDNWSSRLLDNDQQIGDVAREGKVELTLQPDVRLG